jgi:hypothetical protein
MSPRRLRFALSVAVIVLAGRGSPAEEGAGYQGVDWLSPGQDHSVRVGQMATPRGMHALVSLPGGRAMAIGGRASRASTTMLASTEIFDPARDGWVAAASMPVARSNLLAATLRDGRILVAGGAGANPFRMNVRREAFLYDPETDRWAQTGSLPVGLLSTTAAAVRLDDGRVLVAGGLNESPTGPSTNVDTSRLAFLYDPVTGAWSAAGELVERRLGHAMALLRDGRVLVVGGARSFLDYYGSAGVLPPSAEIYDPASNGWRLVAEPLPVIVDENPSAGPALEAGRFVPAAHLLDDGDVLVCGGTYRIGPGKWSVRRSCLRFDPEVETWRPAAPLPAGRAGMVLLRQRSGGGLIAIGGDDALGFDAPGIFLFDPVGGTWRAGAELPARASYDFGGVSIALALAGGFPQSRAVLLDTGKALIAGSANNTTIASTCGCGVPPVGIPATGLEMPLGDDAAAALYVPGLPSQAAAASPPEVPSSPIDYRENED